MAKSLLLLMFLLSRAASVFGAGNLIEQFVRNRPVAEDKLVIDSMRPDEINGQVDEEGRTALFYSRHLGTTLLLLAGADPNTRGYDGRTPAFRAVTRSADVAYPIMLDLLLLAHADPNARDKAGYTLLAWAVHEDNLPAVKLLLLLGADPSPGNVPNDLMPLSLARRQPQDPKLAELLDEAIYGSTTKPGTRGTNQSPDQKLVASGRAARLASISDALAAGANVNARHEGGATTLFQAVTERRANVAALLLLNGADPNIAKDDGTTPLMQCVTGYDMASERMLVDLLVAGADVNTTTKDGTTAMSKAVHSRNNTAAQWLIWCGANLDVHSPEGTLMETASLTPDWPSMIKILKDAGLEETASAETKEKHFLFFNAVRTGDLPGVESQLNSGTPVDITNKFDQTAFEWAVCYDRFDIVDVLLRHGANINHQHHYNGENILHNLAGWKTVPGLMAAPRIEELVKRGANPNLVMKDGCTPLMVAARVGVTGSLLEALLKVTGDINARDKQGKTALGLAREHGHGDTVKMVKDKGGLE